MKSVVPDIVPEDKALMEKVLAAGNIMYKYAIRLQTVLRRANGKSVAGVACGVGIHRATVSSFINRYNRGGLELLLRDKTRKSGTPPVSEAVKNRVCTAACTEKPKDGPIGVPAPWRNGFRRVKVRSTLSSGNGG
ncbi:MAG: helix-turn-helix domain containing protein [Treponema sp.]|nr:helix-turn-helix domain containing protein [Treponema sp.]